MLLIAALFWIMEDILIDDLNKEGKDLRALLDTYRPKAKTAP